MENTKNDLSGQLAKLDFDAALRTASIAYGATRRHVENSLNELQHLLRLEDYASAGFPLKAKSLAEDAERLAIAADTYHLLLNAANRDEIKVINHKNKSNGGAK